jgi:hypothetical protein
MHVCRAPHPHQCGPTNAGSPKDALMKGLQTAIPMLRPLAGRNSAPPAWARRWAGPLTRRSWFFLLFLRDFFFGFLVLLFLFWFFHFFFHSFRYFSFLQF